MEPLASKLAGLSVEETEEEKEVAKKYSLSFIFLSSFSSTSITVSFLSLHRGTGVVYDERMQAHEEALGFHPESPQRIARIWAALKAAGIVAKCQKVPARDATLEEILLVHRYLCVTEGREEEELKGNVKSKECIIVL